MSRNDPISVGNRRLLRLADFLDKLPDHRFAFKHFADADVWKGKQDLSCGTSACAMGWATTMPFFRRLGLRLVYDQYLRPVPAIIGDDMRITDCGHGEESANDRACAAIFGLSIAETCELFIPEGWPGEYVDEGWMPGLPRDASRRKVAENIRAFVARRSPKAPTKRA